jgi:hypothetical protein
MCRVKGVRVRKASQPTSPASNFAMLHQRTRNHGDRNPASVTMTGRTPAGNSCANLRRKSRSIAGEACCSNGTTLSSSVKLRPPTGTDARKTCQRRLAFKLAQSTTITGCSLRIPNQVAPPKKGGAFLGFTNAQSPTMVGCHVDRPDARLGCNAFVCR